VANIEAVIEGSERPDEIVQLISHKDSMSWIDSPGTRDNCVGLVANLEMARLLAGAAAGDEIVAVLNVDSLDGKSDEDTAGGKLTHVVAYSTDEEKALAEQVAWCAERHGIDLVPKVVFKEKVNDDDGMYINAGFRRTVMNVGSFPYEDAEYHLVVDVPERVNVENVVRSAQVVLAAAVEISQDA